MIGWVRAFASTWAAKVLLVLLVGSFAIWGVRLTNFGGYAVASVGDESISPQAYRREFDAQVNAIQQRLRMPITGEQAMQLQLHVAALQRLLRESALAQEAAALGVEAPDSLVVDRIEGNPAFAQSGRFSPDEYQRQLTYRGYRKTEFEEQERRRATEGFLETAVVTGLVAPRLVGELLWKREAEARKIGYLRLTLEQIPEPADPGDEVLKAHHEAHADRFTQPELRALDLLWLRPEALADPAAVDEAQIQAAYDAAGERYNRPEQRNLEQLAFDDKEAAEAAADRVRGGATLAMIAAETGEEGDVALGYVTQEQFGAFNPALAEAAFAPGASGLIGPIESDGRFYLMRVAGVIEGRSTPLAEVRDALAKEIATAQARRETAEIANHVEDMIASDLPFAEIAKEQRGLSLTSVEIDAKGQDAKGDRVAEIPADPAFLTTVFEQLEGEEQPMKKTEDDEYWKAIVTKITPAELRPFDVARDAVLADWRLERKREILDERAEDAKKRIENGESLEAAAAALGVEVQTAEDVTRLTGGGLPNEAVEAVFSIPAEQAVGKASIVDFAPTKLVLTTLAWKEADPSDAAEQIDTRVAQTENGMSADALALYRIGVLEQFPSETNWGMVRQTLEASQGY